MQLGQQHLHARPHHNLLRAAPDAPGAPQVFGNLHPQGVLPLVVPDLQQVGRRRVQGFPYVFTPFGIGKIGGVYPAGVKVGPYIRAGRPGRVGRLGRRRAGTAHIPQPILKTDEIPPLGPGLHIPFHHQLLVGRLHRILAHAQQRGQPQLGRQLLPAWQAAGCNPFLQLLVQLLI